MASACVDTQEMGKGLQRCSLTSSDSSKIVLIYTVWFIILALIKHETNLGLLDLFIMCWGNYLLCYPTVYCICSIKLYMGWMFRVVDVLLWFAKSKVWYGYALVYKTLIALFTETDYSPFPSCYLDKIVLKYQILLWFQMLLMWQALLVGHFRNVWLNRWLHWWFARQKELP